MSTLELVFSAVSIAVGVCLFIAYAFWNLGNKIDDIDSRLDLFEKDVKQIKEDREDQTKKIELFINNKFAISKVERSNIKDGIKRINQKLGKLLDRK